MPKSFPIDGPLLPHDAPVTGLFKRTEEFGTVLTYLSQDGRAAIWAPRYSGRTTFLYYLEDRLRRAEEFAVYISPEDHLNLTSRKTLFHSFASHISSRRSLSVDDVTHIDDWDRPDAMEQFLKQFLLQIDASRLTIIIDDCDKLLSTSLVTLLRFIRSIDQLRQEERLWKKLSFVVAGAVSFRNLKLLETDELSPFEKWKSCHLSDLSPEEASKYLVEAFIALKVHVELGAIETTIDYAGGDLRALNLLGQEIAEHYLGTGALVDAETVTKIARDLIANYSSNPSIAYMLSVIAHDPRCLRVVDRFLAEPESNETEFIFDDVYLDQKQRFEMSNQELSGAFCLDDKDGSCPRWLARNRLRSEILRRHFSTRRLVRSLLDLGQFQRVESIIRNRLASELEKDFRDEILSFDETAVRDVIEWFWSHSTDEPTAPPKFNDPHSPGINGVGSVDRVIAGFEAISFVLERVFGIDAFALYEVDHETGYLLPNEFLPGMQARWPKVEKITLNTPREGSPPQEVRAYSAGVYTVEIEEHAWLKISLPLKNGAGEVTGILSLRTERYIKEDWATLFVRVPIIERAVNSIWRLLSRYERDQYKGLSGAIPLISVQFDTDAYRYFKKNIARFPKDLPARFLEFRRGIVLNEIIRAVKSPRSLLIFDLSNINNNVLFELGLAIGLNRPGLPVREKGRELNLAPLEGLIQERYQANRVLGESFFDQLKDQWASYQAQLESKDFSHILNEDIPPQPAEGGPPFLLVIDHNRYNDSREYRRALERAAKRSGLHKVVYLWQSGARDSRFTQEVRVEDTTLLLSLYKLIRRARAIIARIEKIQDDDHYALRFLATGIAMGLAKSRDRDNLVLTARSTSKEGRVISLPGDFKGCEPIHFDTEGTNNFVDDIANDLKRIQMPNSAVS